MFEIVICVYVALLLIVCLVFILVFILYTISKIHHVGQLVHSCPHFLCCESTMDTFFLLVLSVTELVFYGF